MKNRLNRASFPQWASICGAFFIFITLSLPALGQGQGSAKEWLLSMSQAMQTLNYRISFVLLKPGGEFDPYLWRHGVVDGVEMEHLSLQNGPGREVVRIGDKVSYFEPNVPAYSLRSDVINGPLPAEMLRTPSRLAESYNLVMVGRSRITGRAAQHIRVVSKDKSRYGYNLWLDQATGLMLRMDMIDRKGQPLEQFQVTSLQVTEQPDEYFERIEQAKLPPIAKIESGKDIDYQWHVTWLPEGMRVVRRDTHKLPFTSGMVDYVMLSDGLIDISVYLQEITPGSGNNGWLRHESDTLLILQQGPVEVTVVGKIPPQTAEDIAKSVRIKVPQPGEQP